MRSFASNYCTQVMSHKLYSTWPHFMLYQSICYAACALIYTCSGIITIYIYIYIYIYSFQDQPKDEAHLFPFLRPEESASDLGAFYQQIHSILVVVHNTQMDAQSSQEAIKRLVSLAQER